MEYLNKSKICREFLNQYSDTLYPELLPKLIKVAIYALYKTFHKWNFSMQELDEFINFFNYKNRNLELESNYSNNCPSPPCEEYLIPKVNRIQKLNMGFRPPEDSNYSDNENKDIDCYGYGKFYPNDDVYINEKNNFYDENYYIPRTHSYRNIQLYHKRLANPKFITQEKRIYPHWWWNLKDDIEQDDYSEDDSAIDHRPSRLGRFPKNIEESLKKKARTHIRNKSFNGPIPVVGIDRYYDESKIFPNTNLNTNNNNLDNSRYPKRDNIPSDDESRRPYGGTAMKGFRRPFPYNNNNLNDNSPNKNYENNNSVNPNNSPLYTTTSNLNYAGSGNNFNINNERGERGVGNEGIRDNNSHNNFGDNFNGNQNLYIPNEERNINEGNDNNGMTKYFGTSPLKSQIINKRNIKQSTVLSFDKDFNLNGAKKKVRGQIKKGLKYSLAGNKLKEDKRGIRRRKK